MTHTTHRRAALLLLVLSSGCGLDNGGPNAPRPGQFQLVPYVAESMPSGLVLLDRAVILIAPKGRNGVALDTVIKINPSDTTLALNLPVPVLGPADTMQATVALITPAGDTAFRGGPIDVVAASHSVRSASPTLVQLHYTGIGAGADSVVIVSHPVSMFAGDSATFTAVAYKNDAPVPGTPIAWVSLDPSQATVANPSKGAVRAIGLRGSARVMAQLLDGPTDTTTVSVDLPPALIDLPSGNLQIARVSSPLPQPVVVRVKALDGVAIPSVWVHFKSLTGGVFSSDSVRTDSAGLASVQWTLGSVSGLQVADVTTRWTSVKQNVLATSVPAAVAVLWTAATGGLWSIAANWSTGLLPGPLDTVIINLGGTYTVTVDQVVNIAGLLVGSVTGAQSLISNGQNLSVSGVVNVAQSGILALSNAALSSSGGISNAGTLKLLNGTVGSDLSNGGLVLVNGTTGIAGAITNVAGAILRLQGNGATSAVLNAAKGVNNGGTVEMTDINSRSAATLSVTGGTLLNSVSGIVSSLTGVNGTRTIDAQVVNHGLVSVQQNTTLSRTAVTHSNDGTLDLNGGALSVAGSMNLATGSVTNIYVASATQYSQLLVSGSTTLAGELHMDFSAHQPGLLETYTPVVYGSHTGAFAQATGLGLGGLLLSLTGGLTSLLLTFL